MAAHDLALAGITGGQKGFVAVIVFVLLFLLPVNEGGASVRIGRAVFFLVGAAFSATVGYIGMTMATRSNVRVAAAARGGGSERGFHIAFRTGGIVGMLTVGDRKSVV